MAKFNLDQKVWIIPLNQAGTIIDIKEYVYEVLYTKDISYSKEVLIFGVFGVFMDHELLPFTEGMELLYE